VIFVFFVIFVTLPSAVPVTWGGSPYQPVRRPSKQP
jgi:hypothetical protein